MILSSLFTIFLQESGPTKYNNQTVSNSLRHQYVSNLIGIKVSIKILESPQKMIHGSINQFP